MALMAVTLPILRRIGNAVHDLAVCNNNTDVISGYK